MKKLLSMLLCAALLVSVPPAFATGEGADSLANLSIVWMDGCELIPDINASGLLVARKAGGVGLIDTSGREVLPCVYDAVSFSPDGLVSLQKDGMYGAANGKGEIMIPLEYAELTPISRGWPMVARKEKSGLYGAVDTQGREVIPFIYEAITPFWEYSNGYTLAVKDGRQGVLDQYGNFSVPDSEEYGEVVSRSPDGSRLVIKKDGAYAVTDQGGVFIVPFGTYPFIGDFGAGGAAVLDPEDRYVYGEPDFMRWGAIDRSGKLIIPTEYTKIWPVDGGFLVFDGVNCGLFSEEGEVRIPCEYAITVMFHGGDYIQPAMEELESAAGWRDTSEEEKPSWSSGYDVFWADLHEGLSIVGKREGGTMRYGFVDENGVLVVPCAFDQVWNFQNGYAIVSLDGLDGLLKNPLQSDTVSEWAVNKVDEARAAGLVTERTGSYMIYSITRLQFAELAANLVEQVTETELAADEGCFADTDDIWVRKAAQAGIVNGVGDGSSFAPNQLITREQLAVMLCRAMEYIAAAKQERIPVPVPSADLSAYADSGTISEWAVQPMTDLVEMGILQGSDGNLIPQANTTVEQAVLLILRAAEYEGAVA